MSYFDDASLVMIPSGYKTSKVYSVKPTDGSGDLTFSRSNDTATRVNSAGLIEKVRTNLALYSEEFNQPQYTKVNSTIAANAGVAPDGTTTADKLIMNNGQSPTSADNSGWRQNTAITSGIYAFSFYAKAAEFSSVNIRENFNTGAFLNINLTNGVVTNPAPSEFIDATATNVGNGWYRIAWGAPSGTNNIQKYNIRAGVTGDGTSGFLNWGFQVEAGDIATDYIQTTTAAVSVGPVANVPRLDYLNSSCPRLLLEPQRTNLITYSEQLNTGTGGTSSVTANSVVSPDGYTNADTIGSGYLSKSVSATAGTYTMSVFIKYQSSNAVLLYIYDGAYYQGSFNPSTGVATTSTGSPTVSMVSYGNGWWRCFVTATTVNNISEIGFGSGNVYAYGLSLEAGAYATSYIPTLGAAVTRGADVSLTASVPSLIGQTEGTMFIEFERTSLAAPSAFMTSNLAGTTVNSYYNSIYFYQIPNNIFVVEGYISNVQQFGFSVAALSVGTHKIALAYKANDFALYIDGVQIGTDNSGSVPAMNFFTISGTADVTNTNQNLSQALLFKTRLSNADLAALTTI